MTVRESSDQSLTPIDAESLTLNPKVDDQPLDLRCPACDEVIQGVEGPGAEYRCGCDELRRFRIRGSDDE